MASLSSYLKNTASCCLCAFILIIGSKAMGQVDRARTSIIFHNSQTKKIVELYNDHTNKKPDYGGYRIEIFSESGANSKNRAREVQKKFSEEFNDIPSYLKWQYPNFEVRVGDFRDKLEAEAVFHIIKDEYPYAYIKKDEIRPPALKKEDVEAKEDIDDVDTK